MRRVVCTAWGEPEGLVIEDLPEPTPGPGQVVVQVAAAGVNFVDALFVAGSYQIKVPPPFTPGSELAGTVVAVGEDVTSPTVGDRVLSSLGLGAYASHVVVPAASLTPVPDNLSSPAAAAQTLASSVLPVPGGPYSSTFTPDSRRAAASCSSVVSTVTSSAT